MFRLHRGQWKRDDKDRVCRERTKHYADVGTPWQCNVCKLWHAEENFPEKHRQRQCSFFRVCLTCEMKKPCFKCGVAKPEAEFGPAAWKARQRGPPLLQRMYHQTAGLLAMFPVQRTQATSRVHSLAAKSEICAEWYTSMQCMHSLCLRVSSCSSHESTLGPLAPTRNEPATRSNASRRSQGDSENARSQTNVDGSRRSYTTDAPHSATQQLAATPRVYTYICPHCTKPVQSTVAAGQVDHRRGDGCGKKFALLMAWLQAAHIRTHVQHAARWCTQQRLPAEFK